MKQINVCAVKHKDDAVRAASRSGGAFTALSDYILENGGIVYGCVMADNYHAMHIRADSKETRDRMRGSKYIQSKLGDTYKKIKADLESNQKVLFSGTSCQAAGLKSFLGQDYDNLFCVDIVCHGVPSPLVWKKYLMWQQRRTNKTIHSVDFRNKEDFGWAAHVETLTLADGSAINSDIFRNLFLGNHVLRPCCYECPYKSIYHPGDITIADYWGIDTVLPEFDDDKGVSLVLVNNEKGAALFEAAKKDMIWIQTKMEHAMQPALRAPFPRPETRDQFWKDFYDRSFGYIARKYGDYGIANRIRHKLGRLKRKLFK